jgi:hypothetical protein
MKTYENEVDEMIDVVVKLTWNYTILRALFEKKDPQREAEEQGARQAHPQFFITINESLLCAFCIATEIAFEGHTKATSIPKLLKHIQKLKPDLAIELNKKITDNKVLIKKFRDLRNQSCAHRWEGKTQQEVFKDVEASLNNMKEIADLARLIISEIAKDVGGSRKENLEQLMLNKETLEYVANDASQVMRAFIENA